MPENEHSPTAQALIEATEVLGREQSSPEVMQRIVTLAPQVVATAARASVTVQRDGELRTPAASDPVAEGVDQVQYRAGEGPCVLAARTGEAVVVIDLTGEVRWPRVAPRLVERYGVRSMLSLPLRSGTEVFGALNLGAAGPHAFPGPVRATGTLFAGIAALAIAAAVERERAEERAARVLHAEEFNAALAHDLRSRMTTILGASDLLARRRGQLDPRGRLALDLLVEELAHQHRLLVSLLDLARARAAPWPTPPVRLLHVVDQTVGQHPRPVPVRAQPGAATALVDIHPVRLGRIVANLLDNADRHAGGATTVEVGVGKRQAWVAVEDAGPGVPEDQHGLVFTRFPPGTSGGREDSHHLGLALSRQNARLAGGDLILQNRAGGGARFVLLLPRASGP